MFKYPKINSLWCREGAGYTKEQLQTLTPEQKANRHRFTGEYACREFMNIRKGSQMAFAGRTDAAQLPPKLLAYIQEHFTTERMENVFPDAEEVLLFGEGYGKKIQSGGYYSDEQRFVLFDVVIGHWWMEFDTVQKMAEDLDIPAVPVLTQPEKLLFTEDETVALVKSNPNSVFAKDMHVFEGVVARAYPTMLFRDGTPIRFKIKCKDFR